MTSKIKFACDFCNQEIVNKTNSNVGSGFCKDSMLRMWSDNLKSNVSGPHICFSCVKEIIKTHPKYGWQIK